MGWCPGEVAEATLLPIRKIYPIEVALESFFDRLALGRMPPSPSECLNQAEASLIRPQLLRPPPFPAFPRQPQTIGRTDPLLAVAASCQSQ